MDEYIENYIVYIRKDDRDRITEVNSSAFISDLTGWIEVDSGIGDKYHHAQGNYFPKPIYEDHGIPVYKYEHGEPVERTTEEIEQDIADLPKPEPSDHDLLMALIGG